jgi:DNA-binding transcriptional LysR family regulator
LDLNVFSLKVFLKVAESGSFTKASEALFLSQPAVSFHIQKIEQAFQTPLFIRRKSDRIGLTEAGKTLRKHAKELVRLQQLIASDMKRHVPAFRRELRIGVCSIVGEHLVPFGVTAFGETHPEVALSLSILKCEKVFKGLLEGNFDIGMTGIEPNDRSLVKKCLIRAPLVLFKSARGQKRVSRISIHDLSKHSFVLREKGSGCRLEFDNFLRSHGIDPDKITVLTESESNAAIKLLVKDGDCISVLPDFMVSEEINKGELVELKLTEGQPMQSFFLVYRKQDTSASLHMHDILCFLLKYSHAYSVIDKSML